MFDVEIETMGGVELDSFKTGNRNEVYSKSLDYTMFHEEIMVSVDNEKFFLSMFENGDIEKFENRFKMEKYR